MDSINTNANRTINHIHEDTEKTIYGSLPGNGVKMYDRKFKEYDKIHDSRRPTQ